MRSSQLLPVLSNLGDNQSSYRHQDKNGQLGKFCSHPWCRKSPLNKHNPLGFCIPQMCTSSPLRSSFSLRPSSSCQLGKPCNLPQCLHRSQARTCNQRLNSGRMCLPYSPGMRKRWETEENAHVYAKRVNASPSIRKRLAASIACRRWQEGRIKGSSYAFPPGQ